MSSDGLAFNSCAAAVSTLSLNSPESRFLVALTIARGTYDTSGVCASAVLSRRHRFDEGSGEVTARLIEMLLRRKNSLEQRVHAARKLYDIVDDNTHDTSHIEEVDGVSKTLTDRQVNTILGGVLASNDPTLDSGEEGANLVRCCSQLLRLMASTHSAQGQSAASSNGTLACRRARG